MISFLEIFFTYNETPNNKDIKKTICMSLSFSYLKFTISFSNNLLNKCKSFSIIDINGRQNWIILIFYSKFDSSNMK